MKAIYVLIIVILAAFWAQMTKGITETELIARTLYHECGFESTEGIIAVASVIQNRKGQNKTWANVILKPKAFSCWNDPKRTNQLPMNRQSQVCRQIASEMVSGRFRAIGAWNHYYNPNLCSPSWGTQMKQVRVIGNHRFGVL